MSARSGAVVTVAHHRLWRTAPGVSWHQRDDTVVDEGTDLAALAALLGLGTR